MYVSYLHFVVMFLRLSSESKVGKLCINGVFILACKAPAQHYQNLNLKIAKALVLSYLVCFTLFFVICVIKVSYYFFPAVLHRVRFERIKCAYLSGFLSGGELMYQGVSPDFFRF